MKVRPGKSFALPLLTILFSSLIFLIPSWGLTQGMEVEPTVSPGATSKGEHRFDLLDYQPGVPVCEQTQNLVPDPGFEQGIGWPYWYGGGDCTFQAHQPGHNSATSGRIIAGSSGDDGCLLFTPIDVIPVEPNRFYDYAAWVRADLAQGSAHLRITFWSKGEPSVWHYEGDGHTTSVRDTQWAWVKLTGSVQAPQDAEYARVEAAVAESSLGSAWFDDIFLGLSTCLDISKDDNLDLVMSGEVLTYTIVYSNTGREKATGVQIVETYNDDVAYMDAQPTPSRSNNVWDIPSLLPNDSKPITIRVRVRDGVEGRHAWIFNKVEIFSAETMKPISSTISTQVSPPGPISAVSIDPPQQSGSGKPGQQVDYSLNLRNTGSCAGQLDLVAASPRCITVTIQPPPPYTLAPGGSQSVIVSPVMRHDVCGEMVVTFITATLECGPPCNRTAMTTGNITTTVPSPVFLPMVARDFDATNCFKNLWEVEPNNSCKGANGPLCSGREYSGYPNDQWDIFSIGLHYGGRITADLTTESGTGVQLQLVDQGCNPIGPYVWKEPYHIEYPVSDAGQYYVSIFTESGHNSDEPYILWVTFP